MKILYISDLDETLLNSERKITPFSVDVINRYIEKGGLFTIATSCMAFTCREKVAPLLLNTPGIVMNGVCLYSFDTGKYHDVKSIEHSLIPEIEAIFASHNCNTLMYVYDHEQISLFHSKTPSEADSRYLSQHARETCREICQVPNLTQAATSQKVICAAAIGPSEQIIPVYERLQKMADLETTCYPYDGLFCLEVYDHTASKANAVLKLKKRVHATELTVFGATSDDIGMMEAADYCFAPRNGSDDARKIANGLIDCCDDDGIARFIQIRHGL
jgi:hydroxymethylpyrimidine pyrophosphatase-like HAD family hydrolase